MHKVLVNRLGGLSLPRKSVVRLTDRPDMTLDVYRGRKTTIQQQQQQQQLYKLFSFIFFELMTAKLFESDSAQPNSGAYLYDLTGQTSMAGDKTCGQIQRNILAFIYYRKSF